MSRKPKHVIVIDCLYAAPDFGDPDDDEIFPLLYVQNTLAPDFGEHCFKREDGKLIWVGSENGGTDDPWLAIKRFLEAAAQALNRLFLSGHGAEQQEV